MAHSTLKSTIDGRKLAVTLLQKIERLNDTYLQDVKKSRELVAAALETYHTLPAKKRRGFVAILTDMLASAYACGVMNPAAYDRGRLEALYMRLATKTLNENRAGVRRN
jgi:hypothetical protein